MSEGLLQNFEVGLLFLFVDLIITVLLLPYALGVSESRRWRPMRHEILKELLNCQTETVIALKRDFEAVLALFLSQHVRVRKDENVTGTEKARHALASCQTNLRGVIDLLAPAIEPAMAKAIVDLIHLPTKVSQHLVRIDEYLHDLVYFDESLGPSIKISNDFRQRITGDLVGIKTDIEHAERELAGIIQNSVIAREDRDYLIARLADASNEQAKIMDAGEALMHLLTHRKWNMFDNRMYDTTEEWLRAGSLTPYQAKAIVAFGDEDVLAVYRILDSQPHTSET